MNYTYKQLKKKVQEKDHKIAMMQKDFDALTTSSGGHPGLNFFALQGLQLRLEVERQELSDMQFSLNWIRLKRGFIFSILLGLALGLLGAYFA